MPIGIQRLNARTTQPNPHIIFIKPLKGPGEAVAQDFLERIAAQCLPIMKEHHISVMSLEEYEPNNEFAGRNFNAGEVIQLVLKSRFTNRWLPFEYVQMVMMHELAHCKQMNHSRAFWAVRNQYAEQMRTLWNRGYTGEGLWGRGTSLTTGEWEANTVIPGEPLPEHLCGGTYRSRGRKRKGGPELSYQERKERRILKKFGANGVALGEDETVKAELEKGRRTAAKPRVAGSKRGRELRAAAALARFGQQKKEEVQAKEEKKRGVKDDPFLVKEEDVSTASEPGTEDEYEEGPAEPELPDAVDIDGKTTLLDSKGRGMVKVCEDENPDDQDAGQELSDLRSFLIRKPKAAQPSQKMTEPILIKEEDVSNASEPDTDGDVDTELVKPSQLKSRPDARTLEAEMVSGQADPVRQKQTGAPGAKKKRTPRRPAPESSSEKPVHVEKKNDAAQVANGTSLTGAAEGARASSSRSSPATSCPVCSFANDGSSFRCAICSNVLNPELDARSWKCGSAACADTEYVNAGDCGVCGVCGQRKT